MLANIMCILKIAYMMSGKPPQIPFSSKEEQRLEQELVGLTKILEGIEVVGQTEAGETIIKMAGEKYVVNI